METIRSAMNSTPRADGNPQAVKSAVFVPGKGTAPEAPAAAAASTGTTQVAEVPAGKPAAQDTREQLQALLDQVEERIQPDLRALSFRVSEEIGGVVVSVIDSQTEELIRQIPTETVVRLAERLQQINAESGTPGLLLNDQA